MNILKIQRQNILLTKAQKPFYFNTTSFMAIFLYRLYQNIMWSFQIKFKISCEYICITRYSVTLPVI